MANIGEQIKKIRKEKGLSQKDLGEMLGVSQQMVGQYESPNANLQQDTITKIANALNVPESELIGFDFKLYEEQREELNKDNDVRHHLLIYYYDRLERTGRDSLMEILVNLLILNSFGQKEAVKRVEELTEFPQYIKSGHLPKK